MLQTSGRVQHFPWEQLEETVISGDSVIRFFKLFDGQTE